MFKKKKARKIMQEENLEEELKQRLEQLRTRRARNFFLNNLNYPYTQKEGDRAAIIKLAEPIESILPKIKDLIKNIKKYVPFIGDQTKISAAYLLLGKSFSNLEVALHLIKEGRNVEAMDICRSGNESIDLSVLFLEDNTESLLERWFKGEIIGNEEARRVIHNRMNSALPDLSLDGKKLPINKMLSHIYKIYSMYIHSSYGAIFDSIDVFHEDFDFDQYSGFHYAHNNFHIVRSLAVSLVTGLKNMFLKLGDQENFHKADALYRLFWHMKINKEDLDLLYKKYGDGV